MASVERVKMTPPQLARLWGVTVEKIVSWIRSGELAAIDGSTSRNKRPRFLIDKAAIQAFEQRRAVVPSAVRSPRRRRRSDGDTIEFF